MEKARTIPELIKISFDDIEISTRTCNLGELLDEVDNLSNLLRSSFDKNMISSKDFLGYKKILSDKIDFAKKNCDCNVK